MEICDDAITITLYLCFVNIAISHEVVAKLSQLRLQINPSGYEAEEKHIFFVLKLFILYIVQIITKLQSKLHSIRKSQGKKMNTCITILCVRILVLSSIMKSPSFNSKVPSS